MDLTFNSLPDYYLWQRVSLRNLEVFRDKTKIKYENETETMAGPKRARKN